MAKTVLTLLLLGIVAIASASSAASRKIGNVQAEISLEKSSYELGENVEITLSLINQGVEDSSFQFPTGQMYDFLALRDDQPIWQWSQGRVFTQAFTTLSLKPGESKDFHARWNQRDVQNRQVMPGEYEMVAVFPSEGGRIRSSLEGPRVRFRIGAIGQIYKPEVTTRSRSVAGSRIGEVLLNNRPVLRIRIAAGGLSAADRAAVVANRLQRFLDAGLKPEELSVSRLGAEVAIVWRNRLIVTADTNHARLNNTTARSLALQWRQSLVDALSVRQ